MQWLRLYFAFENELSLLWWKIVRNPSLHGLIAHEGLQRVFTTTTKQ